MNAKKCIKLLWSLALGVCLCFGSFVGCSSNDDTSTSDGSDDREIVWTDKIEPEEVESPTVNNQYVVLPEKPAQAPADADTTQAPRIGTVSVSNACYTVGEEGGKTVISYNSVEPLPAYAYAYFPVENYHADYEYFKLKGTFTGVQRITVLAVYYEQYAQNRPAVTVYNNAVVEGENTIVADLSEAMILNDSYNVVTGEHLVEKQIIGFMVMLDSNPKQVIDEYIGKVTLTEVGIVDETDSDLAVLYAAPFISDWSGDPSYSRLDIQTSDSTTTDSKNATIEYEFSGSWPYVAANIMNFKSDFSTLRFKMHGSGVKNLTIAIAYSITTTSNSAPYAYLSEYGMTVPTTEESFEYDFSALEEMASDFSSSIPGSYVKNLRPTAIYFYIDTVDIPGGSGTLYINDMEFVKTVSDGTPTVTSTWSVSGDGLTKSNIQAGGIGTITYNKTQGWTPVTVNVAGYSSEYTTLVVKVKFYGAKNLGIALGYGSNNVVIQNSDGKTTADVTLNTKVETGTDDGGEYTFYIYTIDFSAAKIGTELLCEQNIAKIMFYIDAVFVDANDNTNEISAGSAIDERTMQFVGIAFEKPVIA